MELAPLGRGEGNARKGEKRKGSEIEGGMKRRGEDAYNLVQIHTLETSSGLSNGIVARWRTENNNTVCAHPALVAIVSAQFLFTAMTSGQPGSACGLAASFSPHMT